MAVLLRDSGAWTVAEVRGDLDVNTASRLSTGFLDRLAAGYRKFVIDLTRLQSIDVAGLEALRFVHRAAEGQDITVRLAVSDERACQALRATPVGRLFTLHPGLDAAMAAVDAEPAPAVAGMRPERGLLRTTA